MKQFAVAAIIFLFAAADLHAQASTRRRPAVLENSAGSPVYTLDSPYPFAPSRSRSDVDPGAPRPGNAIPVSQLHIPGKAIKEYERSQKSFSAGDLLGSAGHLEKAIQIYPEFLDAHNQLGSRYIGMGKFDLGLAEYQRALALDPRSAETYHNLAVALFFKDQFKDAEQSARRSLEFAPQSVVTRYILARTIIQQGHVTSEALDLLGQTESQFPDASLVLAQIYFGWGKTSETAEELRVYLKTPNGAHQQKAQCWLAHLTHQPVPASCPSVEGRPSFK